jgi:histone deacetylase 6
MIGDLDYIFACETFLFPKIKNFAPDAIIISAGFDSAYGDLLGRAAVTPLGYSWMTHGLSKICPKILAVLEGGYEMDCLSKCSLAVLETLAFNG